MAEFTYYGLLGLTPKVTEAEIKEAYKERARYYHPDVTSLPPEIAEAQLKVINEAYAVIGNAERRQEYDAELAARQDRALLGEYADEIGLLYKGKWKRAIASLRAMVEKAPESDLPHGLLASAFHMQAIAAFEEKKYKAATKLLHQALDIGFDDLALRKAIKVDLALVEQRKRSPGPLTDLSIVLTELNHFDRHRQLRALAALETGAFKGPEAVSAVQHLAARSLFREVRMAALRVLLLLDSPNGEAYDLALALHGSGKDSARLKSFDRLAKILKRTSLRPLLLPFLWDSQEDIRLGALGLLRKKDFLEDLAPLLWSQSEGVQRQVGKALKYLEGGWGALLPLPIGKGFVKAKRDEMRKKLGSRAALFSQIALFWEQPAHRGELIKRWASLKRPERVLEYVLVAFFAKNAGVSEPAREFLAQHGAAALEDLLEVTRDEDWVMRLNALQCLRGRKEPEVIEAFLAALGDARQVIVKEAIEYLGEQGEARAIDPLRLLFRHEEPEIVQAAQDAVNKLRNYTPPTLKKKSAEPPSPQDVPAEAKV